MMARGPALAWRFVCLVVVVAVGCSKSNPKKEVVGTVRLGGQPLDQGVIEFHPLSPGTPELPATMEGAVITAGEYRIEAEQGLVPGKYRVLITSGDGINPNNPDGLPEPSGNFVSKDRIPAAYNSESKVEVEVKADGPNRFDFDIPLQ